MKRQFGRTAWRFAIPAVFAFSMQIVGPLAVQRDPIRQERAPGLRELSKMVLPGTNDLQLIIELSSPSVVQWMQSSTGGGLSPNLATVQQRMNPQSAQANAYRTQLARERQLVTNRLSAIAGVQVQSFTDTVMHAVIARVPVEKYREVRSLPGVKKVYFSRRKKMLLNAAAGVVNAQGLWNVVTGGRAGAGQGIKIGIIDSGIDITNPMFINSSLSAPAGFPKYDNQADRAFTNSKVIVARNYILSQYGYSSQTVQTAIDEVGHGTFVSGVAAGEVVGAPLATISGMAPGAYLGSYKIFGTPNINDDATDAGIIAAIDDAVNDGMDILNLSLGALDYVPPSEDPEVPAIETAISDGLIVTISAGNDGPNAHTIGSPGTTPDAITVGAVSNSRMLAPALHVTSPAPPSNLSSIAYVPGSGGPAPTSMSAAIVDVATLDGNGYGCSAFASSSLRGDIAFVERGGQTTPCTFVTKITNSYAAGAVAVVVYDNVPTEEPITMSASGTTIPAVMISNADGQSLKQFIDAHSGVQVSIDSSSTLTSVPTTPGVLAYFSSTGPNMDFSLKPDMVAVGEDIYSAVPKSATAELYDPTGFTSAAGTSFSAPMVAGAAAALKQLFLSQNLNLSPLAIKSILTSTASPQSVTTGGSSSPQVLQMGSGLLNMGAAAAAGASFAPSALSFGAQAYNGTLSLTRTLVITNISNSTDQFAISVNPIISGPAVTLSETSTGPVSAGSVSSVNVTLQVTAPQSGGFQGFVTVQSSNTSHVYQIPYWAGLYVLDPSTVLHVAQAGSSYSSLSDALNAARPGNIIEIEDSATYSVGSSGLVITTNSEGLPLHGITIRAAAGQAPIIDGSGLTGTASSPPPADIWIVGLQNVLLQGLTINSGYTGIELTQPSTDMPLSVTLDNCTISNSNGDLFAEGVLIDGGGTINITQSTLSSSTGTGILAGAYADGTQLTLLGTTVQLNGNDGLDAYGSNVDILNSTFSSNQGAGFFLDGCTGTVEGNTIAQSHTFIYQNQYYYGDGLQVADNSNIIVKGNLFNSNDESGMWLTLETTTGPGPVVKASGNTFQANLLVGVEVDQSPNFLFDSNLIQNNATGVYLGGSSVGATGTFVNNIILGSTPAAYGDGIEVDVGSNVQIINNTIYNNTRGGIYLMGGTASVFNTIAAGNPAGDMAGVPASNMQFCLVSNGSVAGNNKKTGNTGNPGFTNPAAGDYSLAAGSPALDAGSNSAPGLPFLDYYGRFRVAASISGSAMPGSGTVDIGAIEANSTYPLIYPLLANGTLSSLGDTFTTGYAMLNDGSSSVAPTFAAYAQGGTLLPGSSNPDISPSATVPAIGAGSQFAVLDYQLFGFAFGTSAIGSMLVSSLQPLEGFLLLFDSAFSRFSIGANATNQAYTNLLFMQHESDASGNGRYVVFNPGVDTANVTATPMSSAGTPLGTATTIPILPKSQNVFNFDNVTTSPTVQGYVNVQSDRPVSGIEVISSSQAMSAFGAVSPGSEARLFFPHFAVNQGWSTQIGIINVSGNPANVTLTAYDGNGQTLGTPAAVSLANDGQLLQSADSLLGIAAGPLTTGYIVAQSDQPIQGFTSFRYDNGTTHSAAVVPAGSVPQQLLLFSHVAHNPPTGTDYLTGIALLNPFGTSVGYTLTVYDSSGNNVAQMSDTLGPGQKVAKYLSSPVAGDGFFTQTLSLGGGHVEVQTNYGLIGFELFYTESFSQLASVPAQSLR